MIYLLKMCQHEHFRPFQFKIVYFPLFSGFCFLFFFSKFVLIFHVKCNCSKSNFKLHFGITLTGSIDQHHISYQNQELIIDHECNRCQIFIHGCIANKFMSYTDFSSYPMGSKLHVSRTLSSIDEDHISCHGFGILQYIMNATDINFLYMDIVTRKLLTMKLKMDL